MPGPMFIVSRRFGLEQSDKIRSIDDMSESLVNSAYGSSYKLDLPGIDGISTTARSWLEAVNDDRRVHFKLSNGKRLKGVLHKSLDVEAAKTLCGRTLDLDAAYKQILTAKSSLWCSALAVDDPSGRKRMFVSNVLPFGASASVYGFNRIARACHTIGLRLLGLVWSNYYDDFPQIDLAASEHDSQVTAERLFELIGWKISRKESKRMPTSRQFDALGVLFDFSNSTAGIVEVRNKASRVDQLCSDLERVCKTESLSVSQATSIRGKLQFAETHTFGRALASHVKLFNLRASGKRDVSDELRDEILWIIEFLRHSMPCRLTAGMSQRRLYIFTDAALENYDTCGSVGMVAYFVDHDVIVRRFFFSGIVPSGIMNQWQNETAKVISTLELFAAVYAVQLLSDLFEFVRVMLFIDNEAARASLISLKTSVERHRIMLRSLSRRTQLKGLYIWTARVPSVSNCSDEPSRLKTCRLLEEGYDRLEIDWHVAKHVAFESKCRCASLVLLRSGRASLRRGQPVHVSMLMFAPGVRFHVDACVVEETLGSPHSSKQDCSKAQDSDNVARDGVNKNRLAHSATHLCLQLTAE